MGSGAIPRNKTWGKHVHGDNLNRLNAQTLYRQYQSGESSVFERCKNEHRVIAEIRRPSQFD